MAGGVFKLDSIFIIPQPLRDPFAEGIEHREGILRGAYVHGVKPPVITYEDGSPLHTQAPGRKAEFGSLQHIRNDSIKLFSSDRLPFAPNTVGLNRPLFYTVHFDFSMGLLFTDFSSLNPLNVGVPSL